jgi:glycosyltransferase involved in cell wall biosynthesis
MDGSRITIVLPVRNGGRLFRHLALHLEGLRDRLGLQVLVIDSGSDDGTPERAAEAGFDVHRIPPDSFGHGRTRNLGVRLASGDVVCFITHDVLPVTPDWPVRFAAALEEPGVAGVYGRQVPRDATTMEMFFVALNYPPDPDRYDPDPGGHHPRPGRVVFSNAFSAVRRDIALEVPIPDDIDYSEDQVWARRALAAGYSIVYEPGAEALHAHVYRLRGVFRRSFSVGRALRSAGIDRGASFAESVQFLATELRYFVRQGHVHRLPQLVPYEFLRWAGFQAGRLSRGRGGTTVGWSASDGAPGRA